MTTSEKQRIQQAELHKKLWKMANELRGQMTANDFKDYILGLIFFRYLSEKVEEAASDALQADALTYREAFLDEQVREDLQAELVETLGYIVKPDNLFSTMIEDIQKGHDGTFSTQRLQEALNDISDSTIGEESEEDFKHLFSDMDLASNHLGQTVAERSKVIAKIMGTVNEIPLHHEDSEIDVLGDAYEYLISQFAANAGKKAGEFFTPQAVSTILSKLVTAGRTDLRSVYDPTCGSGSLLLRVAKDANVRQFFGQEMTSTTYNLARMNMLLHDVPFYNFDIRNGNTLSEPHHLGQKFDAIVSNPPYSANWGSKDEFSNDSRFNTYGGYAPKSKADFAFIQHMLHQLEDGGTMAVVLPHGVLFRGAGEGKIRKELIEQHNCLDAIIGLPANIFYGTSIPTSILVFKKNRDPNQGILFIDASLEFERGKNQNTLSEENVEKIVETYEKRTVIAKYSHEATLEEVKGNDYNLNIPRYVDTFEEEEAIDMESVFAELKTIDSEIKAVQAELLPYFEELGIAKWL